MAVITEPRRAVGVTPHTNRLEVWKHFDFVIAFVALAISAFGALMIYSASRDRLLAAGSDPHYYLKRQALFIGIGFVAMIVVAGIDYGRYRDFAPVLYVISLVLLLAIYAPKLGHKARGAQAWLAVPGLSSFQVEPSEFAKILLIVSLGTFLASKKGAIGLRTTLGVLLLAVIPMGLIYKQPDLGTALVLGAVLLAMFLVGGVRGRHMALLGVIIVVVIVGALHFNVLKKYQTERITSFLTPSTSISQSTGYNQAQSRITISSGSITGKGLFKGTQTNLAYVPEQHTDFIFTAVGEQLGLVGCAGLILAFGLLIWRVYRAAVMARDHTGSLICAGVIGMIVFQVFENVGMTLGIMPVAGIPLPFVSYGGSAIVASFIAVGLVINVHMRRDA